MFSAHKGICDVARSSTQSSRFNMHAKEMCLVPHARLLPRLQCQIWLASESALRDTAAARERRGADRTGNAASARVCACGGGRPESRRAPCEMCPGSLLRAILLPWVSEPRTGCCVCRAASTSCDVGKLPPMMDWRSQCALSNRRRSVPAVSGAARAYVEGSSGRPKASCGACCTSRELVHRARGRRELVPRISPDGNATR